jgi:hypothetical protein
LDLEVEDEDISSTEKMTPNDACSLKNDANPQNWGIASIHKELSERMHPAVCALTLLQEDEEKRMDPAVCALILLRKDEQEESMTDRRTHNTSGTGLESSTCHL